MDNLCLAIESSNNDLLAIGFTISQGIRKVKLTGKKIAIGFSKYS